MSLSEQRISGLLFWKFATAPQTHTHTQTDLPCADRLLKYFRYFTRSMSTTTIITPASLNERNVFSFLGSHKSGFCHVFRLVWALYAQALIYTFQKGFSGWYIFTSPQGILPNRYSLSRGNACFFEKAPDWWSTVDGWNPANQLRLVVYPIYRVSYIPGGARFQPSTVSPQNLGCWSC